MFEKFGNFHYGVTGSALGLSPGLLLRAAGFAQIQAGTSKKKWGHWLNQTGQLVVVEGGMRDPVTVTTTSFGDDPIDQDMVKLGIAFYNQVKPLFEDSVEAHSSKTNIPKWLYETLYGALDSLTLPEHSEKKPFSFQPTKFKTYFPYINKKGPIFDISWKEDNPLDQLTTSLWGRPKMPKTPVLRSWNEMPLYLFVPKTKRLQQIATTPPWKKLPQSILKH